MKYKFTGDYPELFIDLGKELQPGEIVDTDKVLDHPRLQVVDEKFDKLMKAEVSK